MFIAMIEILYQLKPPCAWFKVERKWWKLNICSLYHKIYSQSRWNLPAFWGHTGVMNINHSVSHMLWSIRLVQIYALSCVLPAILHGKNLNLGHYAVTFQWNSLVPVIDCYHFIPLLVTQLWLRVTRSAQSKPIGFIFSHNFQLNRMWFDVVM